MVRSLQSSDISMDVVPGVNVIQWASMRASNIVSFLISSVMNPGFKVLNGWHKTAHAMVKFAFINVPKKNNANTKK